MGAALLVPGVGRPQVLHHTRPFLLAAALAASILSCGSQSSTDTGRLRIVPVPPGIDASGSSDVTAELNAFFESVPDTSLIRFPAGAVYRAEGTLLFFDRHHLTLEGNGATIVATTDGRSTPPPPKAHLWPRTRRHLAFLRGSHIKVQNLRVRGANPFAGTDPRAYDSALEAQHGFDFQGVAGVELDHVTVTDVYGDFVYLGPDFDGGTGAWNKDVWIHDSHLERNGRQGIGLTGAEGVKIERNYIGYTRRASIDIEPDNQRGGARRVLVRRNTFGPGVLLFLASGGQAGPVEDVTIQENRLVGKTMNILVRAPVGSRRARIRVVDNVSDKTFGSPIALMNFRRIDGLEVRGNHSPIATTQARLGVFVEESCNVAVKDNAFVGATRELDMMPFSC